MDAEDSRTIGARARLIRSVAEPAQLARQARTHSDEDRYALAGLDLGAVLSELHVHAVTGDSDARRTALAAPVEGCIAASCTVLAVGHTSLAVAVARRGYDAAERLGDPALTGFAAKMRAGSLIRLGARHRTARVLGSRSSRRRTPQRPTTPRPRPPGCCTWRRRSWPRVEGRGGDADTHLAQAEGDRDAEAIRHLDTADRVGIRSTRSARNAK